MEIKSIDENHSALLIPPPLVIVSTWESVSLKRVLGQGEFAVSAVSNGMSQLRFTLNDTSNPNYVLCI